MAEGESQDALAYMGEVPSQSHSDLESGFNTFLKVRGVMNVLCFNGNCICCNTELYSLEVLLCMGDGLAGVPGRQSFRRASVPAIIVPRGNAQLWEPEIFWGQPKATESKGATRQTEPSAATRGYCRGCACMPCAGL